MKPNMKKKIIATLALSATLTVPAAVMAKVSGPCGDCHTMHNSQLNLPMAQSFNYADGTFSNQTAPNDTLLKYGCIGCHTGTNKAPVSGVATVPYVLDTADPTATYGTSNLSGTTLAGGNFYWVSKGDATAGHNVLDVALADPLGLVAPGGVTLGGRLTCAGTNGCHGTGFNDGLTGEFEAIAGGHHGDAATHVVLETGYTYTAGVDGEMANSYRMLNKIKGIEDNDWEFTNGAGDHNVYYGVDRGTDAEAAAGSISSLCATCHGAFHTAASSAGDMGSPWIRHPTDFDMGNMAITSEYKDYTYSVEAPVASDDVANITTITLYDSAVITGLTTGPTGNGDAIVTCVSCHRAHGSPYADLLRWDYSTMDAHNAAAAVLNTGCFTCHTTKDD